MKKTIIKTFIVLVLLLIISGCVATPKKPINLKKDDYSYLKEYLNYSIKKDMKKYDIKALSIAIVDGNKTIWQKGFGLADEQNKIKATTKTVYRIGSISKVITATQIMNMYNKKKIDIDLPVNNYIKEFSIKSHFSNDKPITIRSLLSHHSGLPSDILAGMWVDNPVSLEDLMQQIQGEYLASSPQSMYKYSNIGYSTLGRVIEIIEKKPFSQVMNEKLLQPLGMLNSSFKLTPNINKLYAKGYIASQETKRTPLRDLPAGAMLSNVEDMSKYMKYIFSHEKNLNEMFRPQFQNMKLDFKHKVGLDWILGGVSSSLSDSIVWHNGAGVPHQAHISLLKDKKIGVVILSNTDEASQFITELGVKSLELTYEAKYVNNLPKTKKPNDIIEVKLDKKILQKYVGKYVVFGNMTDIKLHNNHLQITLWGNDLELIPINKNTFIPKATALGFISIPLLKFSLEFKKVEGKYIALLHGLPAPFAFEKIPKYSIPQAWKDRLGLYKTDTEDENFKIDNLELKSKNSILYFSMKLKGKNASDGSIFKMALNPISDTQAIVIGLANGEGATVQVLDNKLYYSGFIFEK